MFSYWRKLDLAIILILLCYSLYSQSSINLLYGTISIEEEVSLVTNVTDIDNHVREVSLVTTVTDIDHHVTFVSAKNESFRISTDMDHNVKLPPFQAKKVMYLRKNTDIITRGKAGNCTSSSLDVLAWIMNEVNNVKNDAKSSTLMIAYGGLIHIHREKEFVNKKTGQYIDDDIDLWASLETLVRVGRLEPELFKQHGWTIRAFIDSGNYVTFLQVMAVCGHTPSPTAAKLTGKIPAIEIYGVAKVQKSIGSLGTGSFAKDLWQGNYFSESMFYPPKKIDFITVGASQALHLQLPNKVLSVMACVYGNWKVPSGKHASKSLVCP